MAEEGPSRAAERLCASLAVGNPELAMQGGLATPARYVEVRLDLLLEGMDVEKTISLIRLLAREGKTVIATLRERSEGGRYKGGLEEKLGLLEKTLEAGASWVDLEEALFEKSPQTLRGWLRRTVSRGLVGLIISSHSGGPPPREVPGPRINEVEGLDRVIYKRVYTAGSPVDNGPVLRANALWPGRVIAFNMGPWGRASRIMAPWLGAPFTYVYPAGLSPAAPGQVSDWEMIGAWRALGLV